METAKDETPAVIPATKNEMRRKSSLKTKPLETKKSVSFVGSVTVKIARTEYGGKRLQSPPFYSIEFWLNNKLVHYAALSLLLISICTEAIILGVGWWLHDCDKPLQYWFIGDIAATVLLFFLVLFYSGFKHATSCMKKLITTPDDGVVLEQPLEISDEEDVELEEVVVPLPMLQPNNTTPQTPTTPIAPDQATAPVVSDIQKQIPLTVDQSRHERKSSLPVQQRKMIRRDSIFVHKNAQQQHHQSSFSIQECCACFSKRAVQVIACSLWFIAMAWGLCSCIYVFDAGECLKGSPILFSANTLFFCSFVVIVGCQLLLFIRWFTDYLKPCFESQ
jgi:hypothetical protein